MIGTYPLSLNSRISGQAIILRLALPKIRNTILTGILQTSIVFLLFELAV